jgi:hypothetical protein
MSDDESIRPVDDDEGRRFRELQDRLRSGDAKLDFSRFHPLDHRLWECWRRNREQSIYGKSWTHLKYWWMYKRPGAWK